MNTFSNSNITTWSIDKKTNLLTMSARFKEWVGCSNEELSYSPKFLHEMVYKEDAELFKEHMDKWLNGHTYSIELRVLIHTDELRWVQCMGIPVLNSDDEVCRIDGIVLDITDRRAAQEQVENKLSLYQAMLDTIDVVIWSYDMNSRTVAFVSDASVKITGYSADNYSNMSSWTDVIHKDDILSYEQTVALVRQGIPSIIEYRIIHANGETRWVQGRIMPSIDESGRVVRLDGALLDITAKKGMEEALHRSEQRYKSLFEYNSDVVCELDLNGNVLSINPSAEIITGERWDAPEGSASTIMEVFGAEQTPKLYAYFDKAVQGYSEYFEMTTHHKYKEVFHWEMKYVPIYVNNRIVGVFVIAKDVTVRNRVQNELRESEERYRRLIELSPQPMVSHYEGKVVYVNPAGLDLLGATRSDELVGKSIYDFMQSSFSDMVWTTVQGINKKCIGSSEIKILRLDGRRMETKITGIYDDKTGTILTLIEDITERLQMQRALQESEERYRRLVELSPVAIAVCKEGVLTYMNPAGSKMLDIDFKDNTLAVNWVDWIHPHSRQYARDRMKYTRLNGCSAPYEHQMIRSDNVVIDVSMISIYDSQSSSMQLMFEDITARKQVERALMESEELNRRIIELSPEAIALHSDYKFIHMNPSGLALFGVSSLSEVVGQSIFDWIHPDYTEKVAERLEELYKEHKVSALIEEKIISSDGVIIDVEVIANTIMYKGEFACISLIRDIRERKRAEEDRRLAEQIIRESEERYFRLQTSLDRFSNDLFGVMKVSQMEQRLLQEVRDTLQVTQVKLIQVEHNDDKLCKIMDTPWGHSLKIGECKGWSYLLCIDDKPSILEITPQRVWLETLARYVSVLFDNFLLIEGLTKELEQSTSRQVAPKWLLRFLFKLSENERKHLAQDLHDAALQEQIIWYRKLGLLLENHSVAGPIRQQLESIAQGLLDVIYQIRNTCNELRPPMLIKEGLTSSLEALFDFTQLRANYGIKFNAVHFDHALNDDLLIGLYRIVQELLANATKHSSATEVCIELSSQGDRIRLEYKDNGVGMELSRAEDSFDSMGIYGMKERVRSMDGSIEFHSSLNNGLSVFISIPAHQIVKY
ncbi:Sensor histidine kinase ComP [compost metagenome]